MASQRNLFSVGFFEIGAEIEMQFLEKKSIFCHFEHVVLALLSVL